MADPRQNHNPCCKTGLYLAAGGRAWAVGLWDCPPAAGIARQRDRGPVWIGRATDPWQGRARRNIQFAMPDVEPAEQTEFCVMWRNFGRVIGEFPHVPRLADRGYRICRAGDLRDISGGGFMTGPISATGNWALCGAVNRAQGGGHLRPLNNPLLSGCWNVVRPIMAAIFSAKDARRTGYGQALRKGQIMCLLIDQRLREGMIVPFFGHPSETSISHIKLAIKKKVPLVYMRTERLSGTRFRVTISPPLPFPRQMMMPPF